jgi:hypothetical protein
VEYTYNTCCTFTSNYFFHLSFCSRLHYKIIKSMYRRLNFNYLNKLILYVLFISIINIVRFSRIVSLYIVL